MNKSPYTPAVEDGLTDALRSIARCHQIKTGLVAGPNSWDDVSTKDFGPEHDYELHDHGSVWIFDPISEAALQWCYRHLPEDCPRWGARGFAIESNYILDVCAGASRDNLMSEGEYHDAMTENHYASLAGE